MTEPMTSAPVGRAEVEALAEKAAVVDRSFIDRLELVGEDRQRFVGGLVSCDVKSLLPGGGIYGFFPDIHGKILADGLFLALADRLWVELPPGRGELIATHLGQYIIADRVEIRPLDGRVPISVVGPEAEAILAPHVRSETPLPAAAREHHAATVLGFEVELVRHSLAGLPAFTLWVGAGEAEGLLAGLGGQLGLPRAGREALEQLRIEAGIPAWGADFGPDHFPQETGREDGAVSYKKGCYLGQEVIARIHYRGKPNRAARRLLFDREEPPAPGARLLYEGQEVGTVGSATVSRTGAGAVGIAILHRRGWEPGLRLAVEGGGEAEVAELPGNPSD